MFVSEIFHSIQGEGGLAGTPSVFVRTSGCNLRCWFCDTPYTSWNPEGWHEEWQSVLDKALSFECEHVVVTGGEPLLQPDVVPLTKALSEAGRHITIETAGTVDRDVAADLMSISPKLENSNPHRDRPVEQDAKLRRRWSDRHDRIRNRPDVITRFISDYGYQLKFVVDQPTDLDDVEHWLTQHPSAKREHVYLMPQARSEDELADRSDWLIEAAAVRGYQFSPRLHVEWWGNVRGR
ncbi:7-carboxy-7-deazaguanine synthase QueE [Stratiformator vulcanicus]|uniref:7-carboxy-7-deazaguanine synthase n=1 Tax=Stratiformator vulcanicus TaxID=2527980 RepID=A0A517QX42_9PLAN|nr:7-carboxy-7-deazaguanine synthase QueE [Stratiformator vulcanicus]QDT36140.1 7-carboxy-7-deazaguanine synthase [Stratiformator vulcanicus]